MLYLRMIVIIIYGLILIMLWLFVSGEFCQILSYMNSQFVIHLDLDLCGIW